MDEIVNKFDLPIVLKDHSLKTKKEYKDLEKERFKIN